MNKFHLINAVTVSDLSSLNKSLLVELIMRANDQWECWPLVERLCKARGIKHEKNFKGADKYLPGLVTIKEDKRRNNTYVLNVDAILALQEAEVIGKRTDNPAHQGSIDPAPADNDPAPADNDPACEGAYSTNNNTVDNTSDSSSTAPSAAVDDSIILVDDSSLDTKATYPVHSLDTSRGSAIDNTPSTAGVLVEQSQIKTVGVWDEERVKSAVYRRGWRQHTNRVLELNAEMFMPEQDFDEWISTALVASGVAKGLEIEW